VEQLGLDAPVTLLAGDNGSGKSTLVEAIAEAMGFAVEGGELERAGEPPAVPPGPSFRRPSILNAPVRMFSSSASPTSTGPRKAKPSSRARQNTFHGGRPPSSGRSKTSCTSSSPPGSRCRANTS